MRRLQRTKPLLDLGTVRDDVDKWYATKRQLNFVSEKLEAGKTALKSLVQKYGEQDSKGSFLLDLEEPAGEQKIMTLKNQRVDYRPVLIEDTASQILKDKGLYDEMTETVVQLSEDRIYAAYYDNKITDDELARMFNRKVGFNLYLLDVDGKPVS